MSFVHHSRCPLTAVHDGDQRYATDGGAKPDGLWFSVGDGMDWRALVERAHKEKGWSLDALKYQTEIFLSDSASILRVESAEGIDSLTAEYGTFDGRTIEWHRIAQEYEGIIIAPHCVERCDNQQTF